jgi:hypothetical protein
LQIKITSASLAHCKLNRTQLFERRSFQIQKIKTRLGVGAGSHGSSQMTKKWELEWGIAAAHTPY